MFRIINLTIIGVFLFYSNVFAGALQMKEDGANKGYIQRLNLQNGPSVTRDGIQANVNFENIHDDEYLKLDGSNANETIDIGSEDLTTIGTLTADQLTLTGDIYADSPLKLYVENYLIHTWTVTLVGDNFVFIDTDNFTFITGNSFTFN